MSNTNKLGQSPAFPVPMIPCDNSGGYTEVREQGINERAYHASNAMMGLLADHKDHEEECRMIDFGKRETCAQAVARLAVEHADALLAALSK